MILKLFWVWLGLAFLAIGIAVAFHAAFDRQAEAERREPLDQVEGMLRSLRLQGRDEDALRQFVCIYSGNHWEEFYEALFGYEAKREARERWGRGERASSRPRFAAWRDLIADWLDARIAARREADETAMLWKIEERNLQSQGENLVSARRKAKRSALAMVATAAEIKESIRSVRRHVHGQSLDRLGDARSGGQAGEGSPRSRARAASRARPRAFQPRGRRVTMLLGPKVRFLAGAALLAGCIAWMHQNAMISAEHAAALVEAAKAGDVEAIQSHAEAGVAHAREVAAQPTQPLDLPGVPPGLLALVSSFGAGVGGLILIVSSLFAGNPDHAFRHTGRRDPGAVTSPLAPGARADSTRASSPASSARPSWRPACCSAADRTDPVRSVGLTPWSRSAAAARIRGRVISSRIVGRPSTS